MKNKIMVLAYICVIFSTYCYGIDESYKLKIVCSDNLSVIWEYIFIENKLNKIIYIEKDSKGIECDRDTIDFGYENNKLVRFSRLHNNISYVFIIDYDSRQIELKPDIEYKEKEWERIIFKFDDNEYNRFSIFSIEYYGDVYKKEGILFKTTLYYDFVRNSYTQIVTPYDEAIKIEKCNGIYEYIMLSGQSGIMISETGNSFNKYICKERYDSKSWCEIEENIINKQKSLVIQVK